MASKQTSSGVMLRTVGAEKSDVSPYLLEALIDMRVLSGRTPEDGKGDGRPNHGAFLIGGCILDTLAGNPSATVSAGKESATSRLANWQKLLSEFGYNPTDASYLYATYVSMQHGYNVPKPIAGKGVYFVTEPDADVVDATGDRINIGVVSFTNLVEYVAASKHADWDTSLIDTNIHL